MSVIAITHHNENICKIIEKPAVQDDRLMSGYRLRQRDSFRNAAKTVATKKRHATMGLPQETLPDPCEFLKRRTGKPAYSDHRKAPPKHKCERKPRSFPTKEEIQKYEGDKANKCRKDFITINIRAALEMKSRPFEPKIVLEPHGEAKPLADGIEPVYIGTDAFGKTPLYLRNFIKQREKLHQMQKDAHGVEQPKCHYIRRDEREQLLQGLKHNWEELQQLYQGLPILTDTIPKINRKSKLEAELKQLERDIVLVERHPYIYVYDDNNITTS